MYPGGSEGKSKYDTCCDFIETNIAMKDRTREK